MKGTIKTTRAETDTAAKQNNIRHTQVVFKNWALFTNCISKINNMQIGNTRDLDIEMPMYNLIEYGDNYSQTSGI